LAFPLSKEVNTIEKYDLNAPYASAKIRKDVFRGTFLYSVVEPKLTSLESTELLSFESSSN